MSALLLAVGAGAQRIINTLQLAQILTVHKVLEEDRDRPHTVRLRRDREAGRQIGAGASNEAAVAHWWSCVGQALAAPGDETTGRRVQGALRLTATALLGLGMLLGVAVAGAAFAYDGHYPVNLFALLGILVVLPALPLLATGLLLLAPLPGVRSLQRAVSAFNAGRWLTAFLHRRLGPDVDALRWRVGNAAGARVAQVEALRLSQWLGVGFFSGALGLALLLVAFTDLAFGWSTTLNVDPALVHGIVSTLALPWSGWLPAAAPDMELVAVSHYYKLDEAVLPDATRLGEWWPFVLMTLFVYGLLPRALVLAWLSWRRRHAYRHLLLEHPQVRALLDRMASPLVIHETPDAEPHREMPAAPDPGIRLTPGGASVVIWNRALAPDACLAWLRTQFAIEAAEVVELGAYQSRKATDDAIAGMAQEGSERLVVVTKGWEPPLLEFLDFIGELRARLGPKPSITIVPVATSGQEVRRSERDVWAATLARQQDPALYVVEATHGTATAGGEQQPA